MSRRLHMRQKLLEQMPKFGVAAEIGVWRGVFSRQILDVTSPRRLHLIDPWVFQPEHGNSMFGRPKNRARFESMFDEVQALFADDRRVIVHRQMSEDALAGFRDDYFDWLYIDGNHNAPFVTRDLALAYRKVKPGGIIAGDDYLWNPDTGWPVRSAVTRLREAMPVAPGFRVMGQQYMIELPAEKAPLSGNW